MGRGRMLFLGASLVGIAVAHWLTPIDAFHFHSLHLVMRKLFLVPVVLAAVWFGLRGALFSAVAATLLYLPHVAYQWDGQVVENINQLGEVGSVWLVAGIAGSLVDRMQTARMSTLEPYRRKLNALIDALERQLDHESPLRGQKESSR